jgi:hypothetical protein
MCTQAQIKKRPLLRMNTRKRRRSYCAETIQLLVYDTYTEIIIDELHVTDGTEQSL